MYTPDRYVAALRFAATRHASQKVPGTQLPYVVHVVSVASEVIAALPSAHVDDPHLAVACALLHDTVEDTATTRADIEAAFGAAVADGVAALSKDASVAKDQQMADSLRRIRLQPREVWMVKLADRITNLAPPPEHWTSDKKRRYRDEAYEIAAALGSACDALHTRLRARAEAYAQYF